MRSRSLRFSLLKLMILIPLTLDNMVPSTVAKGENDHRRIHLHEAVQESVKFVCQEPQSRAYNLKELLQNVYHNPEESPIQPINIVLKRCDGHSGCCHGTDMSCSPIESTTYYEEIEIQMWNFQTTTKREQWIRVEQHGKCTCEILSIDDRYRLIHQQPNVTLI